MGIAVHRSFLTYVANVVEVQVTDEGYVHIPRVETVVDAGLITNPEAARSQFEGAAVFGTSIALSGSITATNGAIDQSNFNYLSCSPNERSAPADECASGRERRAARGNRRARRPALHSSPVQRHIRSHGKTRARIAAQQTKLV